MKKRPFTLIEMITAFFLISVVMGILFTELKTAIFGQMKIESALKTAVVEEKAFVSLKSFFDRMIVSERYPFSLNLSEQKKEIRFFYETSLDEPFEDSRVHLAILSIEKNLLKLSTFISDKTPLESIKEFKFMGEFSSLECIVQSLSQEGKFVPHVMNIWNAKPSFITLKDASIHWVFDLCPVVTLVENELG